MTSTARRRLFGPILALAMFAAATLALAQSPVSGPTVELSAEASRRAPNDLALATAYFEATDIDPAALSKKVNAAITAALELSRAYPDVETSTAGVSTWPVHAKNGQTIEGWRMRSAIRLESRDLPALSELLGKLQATLAISSVAMQPAPETRNSSADLAATDAIRAFEARARSIAEAFGKQYRIRSLSVNHGGTSGPIFPMMRSGAFAAEAAPVPLEGGESDVVVSVSGTIELID